MSCSHLLLFVQPSEDLTLPTLDISAKDSLNETNSFLKGEGEILHPEKCVIKEFLYIVTLVTEQF